MVILYVFLVLLTANFGYPIIFMANPVNNIMDITDTNASERKKDHIDLAFKSKVPIKDIDTRFQYEPLLAAHPLGEKSLHLTFLQKDFGAPIWVSSMTGGTEKASTINKNLALACGEFKLGMGLGSCRQLLFTDEYLSDFQVRKYLNDQPLYANLGIAQLEDLLENGQIYKVNTLLEKLEADGLIIHVNPMQEWLQPEGDRFKKPPIETISRLLDTLNSKIIVKEVGQGMGPESLRALFSLPLEAIEFAASGGTNFALLEILRSSPIIKDNYSKLALLGHSAEEMVFWTNQILDEMGDDIKCRQVIISGGVSDFLDGHYLIQKVKLPSIYGQASGFLKYAQDSYSILQEYINLQIKGLFLAKSYLKVK